MGSFLPQSAPKYSPITYVSEQQYVAPKEINAAQSTSSSNTNSADEDAVKKIIKRSNKGQSALIQTSYQGVLTNVNQLAPQRKNLLGE
jgi:hypothetical protein